MVRPIALEPSLTIARREVRDAATDWRVVTPMFILAVVFPLIVVFGIKFGIPFLERVDPYGATSKFLPFGAMVVGFFPISFSLVIALESFVGEKERNTLEAMLAMPVSDFELFAGKLMAVLLPPFVLSLVALGIFSVGIHYVLDVVVPAQFVLLSILLSSAEALVMVAGAVVVSSHTTSVRAANLLASFIILPMALVVQGELLLLLIGYGESLWFFLAAMVVVAVILVRMGVKAFNREEILARENDQINLGSIWSAVRRFVTRTPGHATDAGQPVEPAFSLVRLYRVDLLQLLALNRAALAVVAGVVVAGAAVGYAFALAHPLPLAVDELTSLARRDQFLRQLEGLSTVGVFIHNLRATAISAFLSVFSFGAASLVLLFLPLGLAGFLAGQAAAAGFDPIRFLVAFILPHGLVEIPAAALAAAASLRLGLAIMSPPAGFSVGESLLLAVVNWLKLAGLVIPLLLLAAYLEANVTPQMVRLLYPAAP
ncbi:MAG: stage II sporulation protein M [Chloroflexi bacterium]|nr:stage II sporulation protein M [Chloroflexota bacterium]